MLKVRLNIKVESLIDSFELSQETNATPQDTALDLAPDYIDVINAIRGLKFEAYTICIITCQLNVNDKIVHSDITCRLQAIDDDVNICNIYDCINTAIIEAYNKYGIIYTW